MQQTNNTSHYPPVVSVLGHVDHGKTSLLDAIRKTNAADRETGGITQKIGASEIEIQHEGKKRKITFIDTPGHEAFSNMRSYGVSAADILLLVIASDDGVMPQTKESLSLIKQSGLPYIVVFTKKDLETANIQKVKQQLLSEEVLFEDMGGTVPYIAVSAKSGDGIKDLLELILLVHDLHTQAPAKTDFSGVIIESKLDKKRGVLCTVVVKSGTLSVGEKVYQEVEVGKVRALINPFGKQSKSITVGEAAEILGIRNVLPTGSVLYTKPQELQKTKVSEKQQAFDVTAFLAADQKNTLKVILKTEGRGELEAIKATLPKDVVIVFEGQGDITASDVLMAKDFGAIVIGFNVNVAKDAASLADTETVIVRTYKIIYQLLDEIDEVLQALEERGKEVILGQATILAIFGEGEKRVMGVRIREGRIARGDKVKVMRGQKVMGTGTIASLKHGKQDVKEMGKGSECGVLTSPPIDFQVGDVLLSYNINS